MKHPARSRTSSQLDNATSLLAGNFSRRVRRAAALQALGRKIRSIRQSKGMSQAQFARMCRVSLTRLRKIENGKINMTLATLLRLSRYLEATLVELTRGIT